MGASDLLQWVERFSYPAVTLLCWACGLGAPLSEDLILLTGGALVAKAGASFAGMALAGFLGQLGGDFLLYSLGRRFGPGALRLSGLRRILTPKRVEWVRRSFARHGTRLVFAVRFMPGFRVPTYLVAGMGGLPRGRFLAADAAAATICAPLVVYLGYRFGPAVLGVLQRASWGVIVAAATVVIGVLAVRWVRASRPANPRAPAGVPGPVRRGANTAS